ncbi:MAG: RNA 2',3'-cyclic phosphodiesterase [Patescibacteria group bacterium]
MEKRVFLAINLPEEIKNILGIFSEKIQAVLPKRAASFPKAENFHITLHFLGNQNEERIEKIKAIARNIEKQGNIKANLGKFGGFPNSRQPRVLFVDICGGIAQLDDLKNKLGGKLEQEGFRIDKRPFNGHITLARVKEKIPELIINELPRGEWEISRFDLMESKLSPKGATYTILESFSL